MSANSRECQTAVISRKQTQLESRKLTVSIVVLAIVFSVDLKAVIEVIIMSNASWQFIPQYRSGYSKGPGCDQLNIHSVKGKF